MRKVKGKQRILAAMLCVNLVLQGMSLEVFAAEMDQVTESVEDFAEQETESGEIEIWTEMDTEVQEMENLTEVEEQEDDSETKTVSEIEKNSVENEIPADEKIETDVEIESENQEIVSEDAVLQEGEVLSGKCGDNLTWKIENGTLTISGTGDMWDYDTVQDESYDFITTAPWKEYCNDNIKLCIENGVTSIGKYSFLECSFIGELKIPNSVKSIGYEAFAKCSGFTGELIIPDSVTSIGTWAFYKCSGFSGRLVIPSGITQIGEGVFEDCSGFTGELIIPDSVTSIGKGAFDGCRGFSGELKIPNNVTSIGSTAFWGCSGFSGELKIPDSVTSIGYLAFSDCSGFSGDLKIPSSIKTIEWGVFEDCSGFNGELEIPNSVTSIGSRAFQECNGFSGELIIPDSVTSIGEWAFEGCNGFSGLKISNNITSIEDCVFGWCNGFSGELKIPNGVTSIGELAFVGCSGFSGELKIPNGVTSIGEGAFAGCSGFSGELKIPNSITSISGFEGCEGFSGELIIPNSVTTIGNSAFSGCNGFSGELIIPDSVTTIGYGAFTGYNGFSGLKISNNIEMIEFATFSWCDKISGNLVIPNSVITIKEYAFYNCSNLTDVYISQTLNKIINNPFQYCPNYDTEEDINIPLTFHCPKNSYAYNWALENGFKVVEWDGITIGGDTPSDDISGECGDNLTWKLKNDKDYYTLTISGTGDMYDYSLENNISTAPWIEHIKSKTVELNIENGVTSIGKYAFYDCEILNEDLIIPNSLISIGDNAFYNCTKITDIYIHDTLTKISGNPFRYFNALIGTFKNMELTFHCIKDSYAYKWAEDNGFIVEVWDGITIDIKKDNITINGRGYAYARFLLKDNKGQVQKNTTISYSFGGRSYTATSGNDGYVQIRSELISDNKSIKKQIATTELILDPNGKKEKLNNRIVMIVNVTPFTYTQTWKVGMSGSVDIGFSGGISAEVGAAEAEATFGKAYATGKGKGTVALAIEHSGDTQNIKLEQNFNSRVGIKAKGGAETKAAVLGKEIEIDVLTVSGKATVGAGQGIGLKIDNYNPNSAIDNLNIGKFAIAMIGSQTGNSMLIRLVDLMGVDLYNISDKSVGFYANAGVDAGSVKYGGKDIGKVAGVEGGLSYTYTTGKNEKDMTRNHKMELERSMKGSVIGVEFPVKGEISMIENIFSQEYMDSYAVELIEDYNRVARKLKIDLKTADESNKGLYSKRNTKNLSVEFDAIDTQKLENDILSLRQLKLGNLPCVTMAAAKDSLLTQIDKAGVNGIYNRSLSTSVGDSMDFSFGGSLGAKLKLGMGIEGLYDLKYNTESGTYQNGSIIKTSEVSDVSDLISGTQWNDFTDFFTDPVEIALNNAKNFIVDIGEDFVDGVVDTYVTLKTTVEDGVGAIEKWVLHVVKIDSGNEKQRTFNSYGIMAVNAEPNGDIETEKVVFTISDPYYVYVTDEKEQTVNDFEQYPLELTLKYTDEMLKAAGVDVNEVERISIYQYSEEFYGYVCIGGTVDSKNQEVKTEITEAGQYLLAVDTSAPVVTDVYVSGDTNKPLITICFDEMSGLKEVSFNLDGEEVINSSNWKIYYNAANSCISYQVTNELANGIHTVSVYAVDSANNAMIEPFVFEFYIGDIEEPDYGDTEKPDYGDILPEDIPTDGVIPKGLWIPNVTPKNYTGAAITPVIRVYDNNTLLTQNKDYTISYKNNIKANDAQDEKTAPTITVTGKGNYTGKETALFQISPKDLSDEDIEIEDITLSYNKKVQKPTPILSWNGKKLKVKTDFQVQYTDSFAQAYQQVGTYKILVSGTGNFTGQKEIEITITNNKLITKMKADKIADQLYTGKQITPEVTVKDGKTLLKKGKDYTLEYHNNTQIGKASVTIIGIGEYSGKKKLLFNITGGSIAKAKVTGLNAKEQYTGNEITQNCKLTVVLNGDTKTLKKDTDYTVSYANNIHAGKATIIFKGINGFSGVLKQNFTIEAFDIGSPSNSKCKITLPKTVPYAKGGSAPKPVITFNGETLCEGANYTLSYKNNKEITDKTDNTNKKSTKIPQIIVKGKGDFKGTQTLDFQITTQDISNLTLNAADKMYQKKSGAYGTKVEIVDIDGKKLSAGKDYDKDLTYTYVTDTKISGDILRKAGSAVEKEDVIPAGTMIQVSAVGKGSYKGTISGKYRITKAEISKASVKVADQTYTGNPIEPGKSELEIIIKGETLGSDCYEIVKYDTNVNKGKAFITIKGVGDYGGVKTATFKIKSKGFLWWWKK